MSGGRKLSRELEVIEPLLEVPEDTFSKPTEENVNSARTNVRTNLSKSFSLY